MKQDMMERCYRCEFVSSTFTYLRSRIAVDLEDVGHMSRRATQEHQVTHLSNPDIYLITGVDRSVRGKTVRWGEGTV